MQLGIYKTIRTVILNKLRLVCGLLSIWRLRTCSKSNLDGKRLQGRERFLFWKEQQIYLLADIFFCALDLWFSDHIPTCATPRICQYSHACAEGTYERRDFIL